MGVIGWPGSSLNSLFHSTRSFLIATRVLIISGAMVFGANPVAFYRMIFGNSRGELVAHVEDFQQSPESQHFKLDMSQTELNPNGRGRGAPDHLHP
jgi:hypothetical protein